MVADLFDSRLYGAKQIAADRLGCVANVFRDQRQQNFMLFTIRHPPAKRIEQQKQRRLPTSRHGDIFWTDLPIKFALKQAGDGFTKPMISTRWLIITKDLFYLTALLQLLQTRTPDRIHSRNM